MPPPTRVPPLYGDGQDLYQRPGTGDMLRRPEPFYRPPTAGDGVLRRGFTPSPNRSTRRRPRPQLPPIVSTPSPYQEPDLWDTLTIAGVTYLGLVVVGGDPPGVELDVAKPSGRDGAPVRDKGVKPGKIKLTLRFWDDVSWGSWDALLPVIDPRRQVGRRTPVDVAHPALAQRNITRIYVENIGFPDWKDDGTGTVAINCIEFHPPSGASTGRTARTAAQTRTVESFGTAFTGLETPPTNAPAPPSTTNTGPRRR